MPIDLMSEVYRSEDWFALAPIKRRRHSLTLRNSRQHRVNDRTKRGVALRPDQTTAIYEEGRRAGDAEPFGFG